MNNNRVRSWRPQVWIMFAILINIIICVYFPFVRQLIFYLVIFGTIGVCSSLVLWVISCGIASAVTNRSLGDLLSCKPLDKCKDLRAPKYNYHYDDDDYP